MMSDAWVAVFVILTIFGVYVRTSFPSVTGGDSGELLAESCQLGTSHPPGYPLFTMLTHIVATISFPSWTAGSIAWKVNNFCAFLGAVSASMVWLGGKTIAKLYSGADNNGMVSTIGTFLYAFTPLVWEYSTTAEVFALNNFLCAALLLSFCRTVACIDRMHLAAHSDRDISMHTNNLLRLSMVGGLLCGLALANQHASALLVMCVVPAVLATVGLFARPHFMRVLSRAAGGTVLGLSCYMYLPWAAMQGTPGSWGELRSLQGIVRHVLRAEYGTFRLGMVVGSETSLQRIGIYLWHTSEESFHVVFPLLALGGIALVVLWQRRQARKTVMPAALKSLGGLSATLVSNGGKPKHKDKSKDQQVGKKSAAAAVNTESPGKHGATTSTALRPGREQRGGALGPLLLASVTGMWVFYTLVWHCIFSNLPLSAPMPFAVHSRFWMQPNILLYALCCAAIELALTAAFRAGAAAEGQEQVKHAKPATLRSALSVGLIGAALSAVLYTRFPDMDKSVAGDVMHRYGQAVLSAAMQSGHTKEKESERAAPLHSLLLSHTDLDWNPVRYLQHCEGVGLPQENYFQKSPLRAFAPPPRSHKASSNARVTHLNFQIMPYPWFVETQAPLYPHVVFPDMSFAGVSTDRASEGNAQLVRRFLLANNIHSAAYVVTDESANSVETLPVLRSQHAVFPGGVYLDMQSVQEAEIEALGVWRGLSLIPWGTQYRVFGRLTVPQVQELHHYSLHQLRQLQHGFPVVDETFMRSFIPGSWERAAANVFYDAHYQLGVNLLTYCIELQGKADLHTLPLLLDRYLISAQLLWTTQQAVRKYGTFSSSLTDLAKNTALVWMRLYGLVKVVAQFSKEIDREVGKLSALPTGSRNQTLLDASAVVHLLQQPQQAGEDVRVTAREVLAGFLRDHSNDPDAHVFAAAHATML